MLKHSSHLIEIFCLFICLQIFYPLNTQAQWEDTTVFANDTEIERWIVKNNVPALGIGIINEGVLQQIKVFGELKKGVPAPYNAIFNVASLTKPITAMVALKLVSMDK